MAARLAFYHFLALFPVLLLLLVLTVKLAGPNSEILSTFNDSLSQLLPDRSFEMVQAVLAHLSHSLQSGLGIWSAMLSAIWASINGTWAMMTGLNMAYEVEEDRTVWKVTALAIAFTIALAVFGLVALILILYGSRIGEMLGYQARPTGGGHLFWRVIQWPVICALLLTAFAFLYRFAPNLKDRKWQWSTPGAVLALVLWIGSALLLRTYFHHWHSYEQLYGPIASVAMLMLWFYFTSAAILIGGELNSEIEKAAGNRGDQQRDAEEVRKGRIVHRG